MVLCLFGVCIATNARAAEPPTIKVPASGAVVEDEPAVKATELLQAEMFPNASFGMAVESIQDQAVASVVTTGGEFLINKAANTIECRQRIAQKRPVSLLKFAPGVLAKLKLTHQSSGAAIFTGGGTTLRINGDSLLMIAPGVDGEIVAELLFVPDYHSEFRGNYNFFDPVGGISFFEHGRQAEPKFVASKDPVTVTWKWKAGDVFWAGVSPPKPFNWQKSVEEKHVVSGSSHDRYMYPQDLSILRWSQFANVLLLHVENAWESFQLSLVPRDLQNYLRVMRTAREHGMKVAVYTTPKAFLKGTVIEDRAVTDMNDPKVTGWHTGSSAKEFLKQATRVIKEFETDGFFFDEMYASPKSLAASYFLARACRELVGDGNPLYYHSTEGPLADRQHGEMFGRTYCPTIDAHFGLVLKGEAVWDRWDPAYTRYILSSYNISNTPVIQATNLEKHRLTPERVDFWLRHGNVRFFLMEHWFYTGEVEVLRTAYWPRLNSGLQRELEPGLLRPTGVFKQFRLSITDSKDKGPKS